MKSRLPILALTVFCLIDTMQAAPVPPNPGASDGLAGWERGFEGQRKADIGNGSYLNPILSGDRPDPSVLKTWSAEEDEKFRKPIRDQYEHQGNPYYATARLWDDGVIDPADTRLVLGLGLSASANAPIEPTRFGLFRM